jgi:hypothetical protein
MQQANYVTQTEVTVACPASAGPDTGGALAYLHSGRDGALGANRNIGRQRAGGCLTLPNRRAR